MTAKILILVSTTLFMATAFADKKRAMTENDLTLSDCQSKKAKKLAKRRLKHLKIKTGWGLRKINRTCETLVARSLHPQTQLENRGAETNTDTIQKSTINKRAIRSSSLTIEDCLTEHSRAAARSRLKSIGFETGYTLDKVNRACEEVIAKHNGPLPKGMGHFTPTDKDLESRFDGFALMVREDISVCRNLPKLSSRARLYKLSMKTAQYICHEVTREALDGLTSHDPTVIEQGALGDQLNNILEDISIKRNASIRGLRARFLRAVKPGITPGAISPNQLLDRDGEPWYCVAHQPFVGGSSYFNSSLTNTMTSIAFTAKGYDLQDSDGFRYDWVTGSELTGNGPHAQGTHMRHIRLEYFCEGGKQDYCDESEHDLRAIIIEETVKTPGLLSRIITNVFNAINFLPTNVQGEAAAQVHSYLAARARRAQNDYLTENQKDCNGKQLLTGCEMAVNYFVCWDDIQYVIRNVFRSRAQVIIRSE